MSHLLRAHAPISEGGWELIDEEARERLTPGMASRRLVDFSGPHGWEFSSVPLGRVDPVDVALAGVTAARRRALPVVEFNVPFTVSRAELLDGDRGAADVDFDDLDRAARQFIEAENTVVFHGSDAVGIDGIVPACPHDPIARPEEANGYPGAVARAVDLLKRNGIEGGYGLALEPRGMDARRRDRRARRLPALRPPQEPPRRPDRLDARAQRRGRARAARRRLRLPLRPGRLRRLHVPRRRAGHALPRGILHLPEPHPGSRRLDRLTA